MPIDIPSQPVPPQKNKARVLLIDDDEAEYHLVKELLHEKEHLFELKWVDSLDKGIECLREKVDVILLDLFLGDSRGMDTFGQMKFHAKDTPIVILSGLDDENAAIEAIQQGAQDFLVKDHVDSNRLSRVIRYAIKRNEIQKDPENIGLIDPLTSLYNRQGFLVMADQQIKTAQKARKGFFICFAILNDLPRIITLFGKAEADHALLTASEILRESVWSSDLIARMGPDEFAVLSMEQSNYTPNLIPSRVKTNQKYYNAQFNRYHLSLSMRVVRFDWPEGLSAQDLAAKVDQIFADYKTKRDVGDTFVAT